MRLSPHSDQDAAGHLPLHSATFRRRTVALLLLLALPVEQTSAAPPQKTQKKPGVCPKERLTCDTKAAGSCKTDLDCREFLKCCHFACEKKCIDPYQEPCTLPSDPGNCKDYKQRWYFDFEHEECKSFTFGGCRGNANNFLSHNDCQKACEFTVKRGQCPLFPYNFRMECPSSCKSDIDCPKKEKCCESTCGFVCTKEWSAKLGFCPHKPAMCGKIGKPMCLHDDDCPLEQKCCSRCGLQCLEPKK
ncbi:WAP four-disulfide core domain protein 8 [Oryctolagus cuniculus]|uniref:WAP four-disulfide core domain protein 8 n=1 Tax=Oryctolagus cuniculus TaxID=9986 RepID=UPI003879B372